MTTDPVTELVESSSPFTNRLEAAIYEYMRESNSDHGHGCQQAYTDFAIGCASFIEAFVYVDVDKKP